MIGRSFLRGVSVLALALATATGARAAATEDDAWFLRFQPPPGSSYVMTAQIEQDMRLSMGPDQTVAMTSVQTLTARQDVLEAAADGTITTRQVIERVQMELRGEDEGGMTFDSESDEEAPDELAPVLAMIGHEVVVHQASDASIVDIEGFDELWESLSSDDPQMALVLEQTKAAFGDEAFRSQMQMNGVVFPEEAVVVGDTWQTTLDLSNPIFGKFETDVSYEYLGLEKSEEGDCAGIGVEMTSDVDLDFAGLFGMLGLPEAEGFDMKATVHEMSGSGSLCVEPATGVTRTSDLDFVVRMDIAMTFGDQTMGTSLEMDQRLEMRLDQQQ